MGELLVEIYEELNQPLPECLRVVTGDIGSVADTRPSSVKSHGSSVLSYGSAPGSVENPGSIKSREGRRMSSRHPSLKEASKRSIVVPKVTRALSRTVSDQCRPLQAASSSNKEVADNNIRKVRRSLFDLSDGATTKPKLQRCQTFGGGSVSELRRSPRKKHKKSLTVTPKKNRTTMGPSKNSFKTPSKGSLTRDKGYTTPKSNKGGVLVPETPGEKIGQTIFNKHRILKSTGTTLVVESPDVKRVSKYTPRRLRASLTVTRRNSFYSGARSRNWERAKTQLLADRFRGHSDRRSLDLTTIQNVGNANFLFSEIVPASQSSPPKKGISKSVEEKSCLTPKRKVLDFGLDDCTKTTFEERLETMETCHKEVGDISNLSLPVFTNSPAKSTRANLTRGHLSLSPGLDLRKTPIKKVRRALSLCTPSKITRKIDQSPGKMSSCSSSKDSGVNSFKGFFTPSKDKLSQGQNNSNAVSLCQSPNTPKQNNQSVHNSDTGLSTMTPSKRVQFSLALTPSKNINLANTSQTPNNKDGSFISNPQTPKSILKTPMKTPSKTPQKSSFHSSEIFVPVAKDGINNYIKTPTKSEKGLNTPSRKIKYLSKLNVGEDPDLLPETPHTTLKNRFSPVKLDGIVSFTENEIELVSPSKGDKASSKPSVVLFNTPFRVHPVKELSEESTQKMEIGSTAANENTPNLIDADLSMVPGMGPEDVEMMSSLIFGEDIYPDSEIGAFEVSEDDEIMKFNLNCILSTLSSPQKKIDQSPLKIGCDQNEDSRSSLPEKQMPLLDLNSIFTDHTTPKKDPKFEKEYSVSPEISMDPKVRAQIERRNKEDSMYSGVDVTATQVIMKSPQVNTDDRKTESSHDFLINNVCAMRNSEALNQNTDRILNKGKKKLILNTAEGLMSASESNMSTYQAKKAKHVGEPENKLKDMCLKEMKKDTSTSEAEKKTCRKTKLSVSKETKQKICIEEAEEEIILNKSQEKVLVTENTTTIEKSKKISVKEAVEKVPTRVAENVLSRNESKMEVSAQEGEKILSGCGTTGKMSKKKLVNKDVNEEIQADVTNTVKIQSEGVSAELHSTKAAKRHYSESSDELEEDIIQENMRNKRVTSNRTDFKKRRFSERMKKSKDAEKQRNQRSCRKLITSMCELSDDDNSDDDVYLQNCKLTPQYKKRIFDEDSDFLTPVKCFTDTPFTMPLKNVENLPRIPSNESEASSWLEEYDNTKQESNDKNKMDNRFPTGNLSSDEWCKQQKIDVYLSPVGKQISAVETPSRVHRDTMTRRRPETPNDWKITKPRREKRKISEVKGDTEDDSIIIVNDIKNNIGDNETVVDEKGQTKKAKKKKRKGVKLKITKSGEHYQVSETNISNEGSDQNSSGDVKLHLSQSDSVRSNCSDNLDSSLSSNNFETPVTKRKKKNQKESESFITPYRFTRHMSRDLSITPEFFQKLITLSPKKEPDAVHNSQKLADEFLGKRIELEMMQVSKVGTDSSTAHSELENDTSTEDQPCASYPDCKRNESLNNIAEGEWSVKSVPGSPTLKTFIRLQKEKHSILLSPRIELSPLREGNIVPVNGISNCTSLDDDSEKKKPSGSSISHKHSSPLHTSNRKKSKLTDPSLLSLVHLSVSPILNNNLLEERSNSKSTSKSQVKPKSSRRLYRNRNGGHDESP
ncbi:hypothetical protein Hamer_G012450 [Homarus americanus]|uniref:Uncharacterized protein n=2 Tax=Homarus americanus TaxID=6706 RepID=A0A8J5N0W3_HOMAM|nr:hypothetical protein Hamer_G012450 [Homarus americanus]